MIKLFDILDCNVLTTLDTDLLAHVLGLFRLACHVETVAAGDRDHPAARNNQIGAALVALSVARLILLILLHPLCGKQIDAGRKVFPLRPYRRIRSSLC